MKTIFAAERLVLVPETAIDQDQLATWKHNALGQVLSLDENKGSGVSIKLTGPWSNACCEPINVTSRHPDESIRTIANFADTPFVLDDIYYQSVESFWQSLKATAPEQRRRIATMPGAKAKSDKSIPKYGTTIQYAEATIIVGTWDHWQLMKRACTAKFQQNTVARDALVATENRPLVHKVRRDSKTIPGVIMAEIWMNIRKTLTK